MKTELKQLIKKTMRRVDDRWTNNDPSGLLEYAKTIKELVIAYDILDCAHEECGSEDATCCKDKD